MNTIEKRKIENVINADIQQAVGTYKAGRNEKYSELKTKLERTPPASVIALLTKAQTAKNTLETAEKDAKTLGWDLRLYNGAGSVSIISTWSYDKGASKYTDQAKDLLAFSKETSDTVESIERLGRAYTLKIYAGGLEMQTLMDSFASEISVITK